MNLLEILRKNGPANVAPHWRGTWARLWVKPSIFSAQTFVTGVAVFDERGLCDFRFINDTNKFECVYGESGRHQVDQLIADARKRLNAARENHEAVTTLTMPPGVVIDPVGFIAGSSPSDAIESAITEAEMPMAPAQEATKPSRFKSRAPDDVIASVMDSVRSRMGFNAESILREDSFGDTSHFASVNVALPNKAGVISSGWYASAERVQLELLKAVTTVESYMAHNKKTGKAGVFFLRPTIESGLKKEQSDAIELALDQVDWQLKEKGLRVVTQEFEKDLAIDIEEWSNI